ncbi:MAG: helix-turn-helix domain-containing protein [Calothrix sp. MO_167.B12]|nr:helix-turn-helix domain-containing protein [Calothrix sp. MO_167.B12]
MKAYSDDVRQKIIKSYINREGSYRELAHRFDVSLSFIQTLINRFQDTGRIETLPHGGGKKPKINQHNLDILKKIVRENKNIKTTEICELFYAETKIKVSQTTITRALRKLKLIENNNISRQKVRYGRGKK